MTNTRNELTAYQVQVHAAYNMITNSEWLTG